MITSSPVNIEERSSDEYKVEEDIYGNTHVQQKRVPYENIPTNRAKNEVATYLKELQNVIVADDHRFALLPLPHSKNEFDHFLVEVHNKVATKLNEIPTAERKRRYIDTYINAMKNPLFFAKGIRGIKKTKKRNVKRRRGKTFNNKAK